MSLFDDIIDSAPVCGVVDPHFGVCVDTKGRAGLHLNAAGRSFFADLPVVDHVGLTLDQQRMRAHANSQKAHAQSADRRPTRKQAVLAYLEAHRGEWIEGHVLATPEIGGASGQRRLRELRAEGHPIEERPSHDGSWSYRLT